MKLWTSWLGFCLAACALAQPVVTPTPDRPSDIDSAAGYTVSNSFETGYRFATRLGAMRMSTAPTSTTATACGCSRASCGVDSEDGRGALFDEFSFNTPRRSGRPLPVERRAGGEARRLPLRHAAALGRLLQPAPGAMVRRARPAHRAHLAKPRPDVEARQGGRNSVRLRPQQAQRAGLLFRRHPRTPPSAPSSPTTSCVSRPTCAKVSNQYRGGVNLRAFGLALTAVQSFENYKEDTRFRDASALPLALDNVANR